MPTLAFDRNSMARWYAERHLATDPGTRSVYYLPEQAPEREIRFLEINDQIAERNAYPLEPLDFGVDIDSDSPHRLLVLDVTPAQWGKIRTNTLNLPSGWTLEGAVSFCRSS